ncbi:hypothetical protein BO70DRAFT_18555 [Aspergillus heteromorphus CBS 117.55]|uniref:Uncharacterized protein n=1 Tax=Aspergillus heteromorphus CBS 117.55 TaxID=1448321 RepID=A0A317X351_9EURO|nr:uncharacterized protein BO70DRAFT_18555 [Aspergillus heteromorphus CBS 117.55]PWY92765.1 hypothetical protein BO70DRAFT_18555 [Aspergillus heteromorphus CBS 117.55]
MAYNQSYNPDALPAHAEPEQAAQMIGAMQSQSQSQSHAHAHSHPQYPKPRPPQHSSSGHSIGGVPPRVPVSSAASPSPASTPTPSATPPSSALTCPRP